MNITVILGHPYENSFNSAIADAAVDRLISNGHNVFYHNLQEEGFDPVMKPDELLSDNSADALIMLHQKEIIEADGIIIIHPNWWGQPPAILKGWVDRVLRENVAYKFEEEDNGGGLPIGLLKAKAGIVFNTSNTPFDREKNVFGDPLERIWKDCIFEFCGVTQFERKMFRIIADSSQKNREAWLTEVQKMVDKHFPE